MQQRWKWAVVDEAAYYVRHTRSVVLSSDELRHLSTAAVARCWIRVAGFYDASPNVCVLARYPQTPIVISNLDIQHAILRSYVHLVDSMFVQQRHLCLSLGDVRDGVAYVFVARVQCAGVISECRWEVIGGARRIGLRQAEDLVRLRKCSLLVC